MILVLCVCKFDVIMFVMMVIDEWFKQIDFLNKLYVLLGVFVVLVGLKLLLIVVLFVGKCIGIDQGMMQEVYVKVEWVIRGVMIVLYQNQDQVYQDFVNGCFDVIFQDKMQVGYLFLKMLCGKGYVFVGLDVIDVWIIGYGVVMGICKGDVDMKKWLNDVIVVICVNGIYQKIVVKYFDFDIYGVKQ